MAQVDLGNFRVFKTKTDAQRHFSAMLKRYKPGQIVADPTDHADLLGLLRRHPEAESKIGCGVARFFVDSADPITYNGGGSVCFWLERTDGTTTDWSYRTALSGKHRRPNERVSLACRDAIRDQVVEVMRKARDADGRMRCAISGQVLPLGCVQVDHAPPWPFWRIVEAFTEQEGGIDALAARLRPTLDGVGGEFFTDEAVARRFADFHARVAVLRVVSTELNAAMGDHRKPLALTSSKR